MTDRLPGRSTRDDADIPEVAVHEDLIESELSDQELDAVNGGTITLQPPHTGIPGNPV